MKTLRRHRLFLGWFMTALMAVWLPGPLAQGATGTWILNNAGNWTGTPANWEDSIVPNGMGDIAVFRNDITAARTVTLNAPITLGGLQMGDALAGSVFTFAGAGANSLTFDNTSGNAFVSKYGSATDVWQAPLVLTDNVEWNIYTGTLDVSGASNAQVSYSGAADTIKNGAGTLRLNIDAATTPYTGDWIVNFGTLNIGGANVASPTSLGTGTGGITLNGNGRADLAIFSLNNNGTGSDSVISYAGNNDVIVQGAGRLNVDRNFIGGANDRVTHVLDTLTLNGGILQVTSGNSHRLRFTGNTTLVGHTNVIDVGANGTSTLSNLELAGVITDGANSRALIKEGAGRLLVSNAANTYNGVTAVRNGVLQLATGANLGTGVTIVNGGALSVTDTATLNAVSANGLNLVGQLGTSRFSLPVIAYSGSAAIDSANPINVNGPAAGMILAIDGVTGNSSINTANIDLDQVGGASDRVWLSNLLGFDRTYRGILTNGVSGDLRLLSATNALILDTTPNILGGAGATNNLVFGYDHGNAILLTGNNTANVNAAISGGTFVGGGTVSVRVNNEPSLGTVTVNRGVTVNINGAGLVTPLGTGAVTALGGSITTDNASTAMFGNTQFNLYGGSSLFLDNSGVTALNDNRRLQSGSMIDLNSSTIRLSGDGASATATSQTVGTLNYRGGSTISVDTDGTTAGRLVTLSAANFNRQDLGTLNIRNISNTATTFGTSTGTQKLLITSFAPTPTNGMIGAHMALWGGANANDSSEPLFVTYDNTHGIQAAAFSHTAFAGTTTSSIVNLSGAAVTAATQSVQALRFRSTANTHTLTGGTITLGAAAALGQGAGLFLAHTSNNGVTHSSNFTFGGNEEGLLYVATTGGTSGIITLSGVIAGNNGLTRFGDGIVSLTGANTFAGPLTINSGETRISQGAAGPASATSNKEIDVYGGTIQLQTGNARYANNITIRDNGRLGNVNVSGAGFDNLTVAARTGSTAPVVAWIQNQSGSNVTTAFGGLTLNGPAQFSVVHPFQLNGPISGSGSLEKYMNERIYLGSDSSGYSQPVSVYAGSLQSLNANSTAKPFGTGAITLNPGSTIRLAASTNIDAGQVTLNSDLGGISSIGLSYVSDPTTLPAMTINSTAPWKGALGIGAVGFSQNINQSTLWGGDVYLASILGDTGTYTGNLTPAAGGKFLLGTGQGTLRMGSSLTGAGNSAVIGVSMTGDDLGRAGFAVNNSGGTVQYDVPMTYTGNTIINPNNQLRVSDRNALTSTGDLYLNGGTLQADSTVGQLRMIAPLTINNNIVLTADSSINIQNNASDLRLTGSISIAPGSTGVVRQIFFGVDQAGAAANNAGNVYADGGIIDGVGGAGNHFIKAGAGTLFLTGTNTYSGSTSVNGGLLAVNSNADFGNTTSINLPGGGLAIWENSFNLTRNVSVHGGNGWFDILGGLTLTQDAASTIDGTSFIMKRGLGTMVLNGNNSQTGVWIGDGVLQVNSQAALGNPAETGATAIQLGGDQQIGGANNPTRYTGGTLRINANVASQRGIAFNSNGNTSFSGGIDVTAGNTFTANGVISQGSEFDIGFKTGQGTLLTTGVNTWRQLAMTNGTLQFSNSTPWANSTTTAADVSVVEMVGGTIRAVNTTANIALTNAASTTTYNYGGGSHLRLESGAGFSAELAADNLLRVNQGTLVIETAGGTILGGAGNTNAGRLIVTNAINSGLVRGSALTSGIFAAHLIGADSAGSAFFLENDAVTGFKAYSGASLASLSGLNSSSIGDITADTTLSGSSNSIYAFRTNSNVSGGTLSVTAIDNLRQGGILINGSNVISSNLIFDPTSATALGAGTPGEALVYVKNGESATLSGNITANAFTKFGDGILTLSGNNMITGDVSVQDGTLRLAGINPFSRLNSELNINAGATLDLNATSIAVETLGSNNRQVALSNVGGQITNTSGTQAILGVSGPMASTYNGTLDLNVKLLKAGAGVLTLNGYTASTPDSGNNSFTGGTDIYGVNTTGGINLNNTTFALGGFNGAAAGDVNLYSGTLGLLFSNGNTGINALHGQHFSNQVIKIGAEAGDGITVNVRGPGLINVNVGNVSSNTQWGSGNILQVGALNMTNTTLQLTGGNLYRLRVAGTTTLLGSQATFQTNSDGPSGALELFGQITGAGAINKLGDGSMRGIVIVNPANNYTGGTNVIAGDVQVTSLTNALSSGPVRVFPDGTLRIAGNDSIIGSNLTVMSRVNALGAVTLDNNFNPTVLTGSNFSSVYNTSLQLGVPFFTQALNLATIGDGRAFLGSGLAQEARYMAATLGAGVQDDWNPGVGVYRLTGGHNGNSLGFDGVNNVLTGNNFLQVGPQRNMVLGAAVNTNGSVVIRNSNNFTGGTQITEGTGVVIETGGSPIGETPLGSGAVEVYGSLTYQSSLGSNWKADTGMATNVINLRPAGTVRIVDSNINGTGGGVVAGDQGRWGDSVGIDLNGGTFRYDGGANWNSVETIGTVDVRKGGTLQVARANTSSSAQLNLGGLNRIAGGTLSVNYFVGTTADPGFLGTNLTTPLSYNRLNVAGGVTLGGTTSNGAGVINGGIAPVWIVDATTNSYMGYDPTGAGTGFQPLRTDATAPGAGELNYSNVGTTFPTGTGAETVNLTGAATLGAGANSDVWALRVTNNISNTGVGGGSITTRSGGLLVGAGTTNALINGVIQPMTLNFGAAGAGEAIIFASGTHIIQAQMNAAQGLTKFGGGQLQIHSINPGIGGPVTLNAGTLYVKVPFSGSGSPVGEVLNGQDIILNGGTLSLDGFLANSAGTATEIASNVRATALFDSNILVRGDAVLANNGQSQYVRIADLTIANGGGATAMNGNGVIALNLQSGIWVRGTTTLAPEARLNGTFNGFSQSTFAGLVTGAGGVVKFGNGAITVLNGANDYAGGTTIWGTTNNTAVSTVASAYRGAGTPFSTGSITINPGGLLRIADNANIASNAVTLKSDGYNLGGIGIAHNGVLPSFITSGVPTAGQIKVESTGPFAGVLALDYGYYSQTLNMASIPGGDWWLGNSQQAEAFYFNSTLGVATGGKYLLGGGGNQSGLTLGSVLVSANRTGLFENVITGGTPGQVKVEIGAQTADFTGNNPSFVNGNSGFIALTTRNLGLTGDVRVNTNSTIGLGNNFALGNGRLIINGGNLRSDYAGSINFVTAAAGLNAVAINNEVILQGDFNAASSGDMVFRGNVAMSDVTSSGATRTWNINAGNVAVRGVISGVEGSNLIKAGTANLILTGANTYRGYTQVSAGTLFIAGDVIPNVAGPLGISDSPIVLAGGNLRASGRLSIDRDLIINANAVLDSAVHDRMLINGGVSVASTFTLTVGSAAADHAGFRGGLVQFNGPISGAGALTIGTTAAAPAIAGTVFMSGNSNGFGINTYSGGTTIQTARVQLSGNTYFSGPANNPTIISGPLGTGAITFGNATQFGESNRGAILEAVGGPVTIVNALGPMTSAANTTLSFGGHEALSFTRDLNVNSDATFRSRTFAVQNMYQPITFSGILSASGAAGVSFIKTGPGMLILNGANTFATSATTGIQINQGILRINADAALGAAGAVRLNGGTLSVSDDIPTSRQFILQANSGIDVAANKTLTLSAATTGAFSIIKTGPGTLALNGANTVVNLTLGGQAQLNPNSGRYSGTGGIVATTATSGTPFATTAITINGGTLALVGGAAPQALSIPTLNYGAGAAISLNQGGTSSQLTVATSFVRGGAVSGSFTPALPTSLGTLYVVPTSFANLGTTEKVLVSAGAPANTTTGGGSILTSPSIFIRLQTPGDANFARYDAAGGIMEHNVTTVSTLGVSADANVANINSPDVAGAGIINVQAIRTNSNIIPADSTTLLQVARGGLILNGATAPVVSAPLLFGTGAGASLTEALVYVREGQTGTSALTGGVTARDFTKTGPGALEIGGTGNLLNTNGVRLPVVSVQDGTLRFAGNTAAFQNQVRGTTLGDYLGHYLLNVNESGVFDLNGLNVATGGLAGNGSVTTGVAGNANLLVKNGFAVDATFNGSISDGAGTVSLTKSQNGILILSGHGSYSGGTTVQGGRVLAASGSSSVLGRLEAQTVTALGSGNVTLEGGWLRLNSVNLLNGAQSLSEVSNSIDYLQWGGSTGLNIMVSGTGISNGVPLPANITSVLTGLTNNAGINNLTINAPMLTTTEGLVQVNGTTTFSLANTVLRTAGGRLFLAGKVDAAGKTITKTGANDVVLTNSASGVGQNTVGLWKVYGGVLEARTTNGSSNPLGVNPTVELNTGSSANGLRLLTDGDGTGVGELVTTYADTNVRFGSSVSVSSDDFVSAGASRVATDRAFMANNSYKTVQINNLEVNGALGSAFSYFVLANNDSIRVNGTTTFQRDMTLQIDGGQGLTLNGLISGNGTFNRRSNGGTLYINSDNSAGYSGGTFLVGGGRNYFGSLEGNQVTLSNTAKLGAGHIFQGPLSVFQINDAGNLQADQNIYVSGNLSWMANFSLAANLTLEQIRLRSAGLGGIQDNPTDYYLSGVNPSSAALSLGAVYTHALDLRTLGDGMWYLGSASNGVGGNGAYDAATLGTGRGDAYRLGAGGNTLFFGTNGNQNVLTDIDASKSASLIVGTPITVQNVAPLSNGTGTVVLLQNQNYTGSTLINNSSTLDFRGTMQTSGFDVYGTLNVAGEAGTFLKGGSGANIPVTLRPGSTLRFDNTSAGVLPVTATEGRWGDSTPLSLNNSILRLQGNAAVEVVETVGAITANQGTNQIQIVRGVVGRGTEFRTPSITRTGNSTVQFTHNGGTLGSDERLIITGTAPAVINGMVAPWMISASDSQFVTYNADTGYVVAGFDRVQGAATLAATILAPNDRAFVNGALVLNGADFSSYALRIDSDVNLNTATAATNTTNRLIIGSGGFIINGARTVQTGLWAGASGTEELILYNNNTLNVGILANNTTSGRIKASGITKFGSGTFQILSEQPDFSGDIRIQQGALQFQYTGTSATNIASVMGGNGGSIIFQGNNTTLNLRIGNDSWTAGGGTYSFNNSIVLGDNVSVATINYDRAGGSISSRRMIFNNLTFGQNNGDVGQVLRLLGPTNDAFSIQFNGTTTLVGRSSFSVDNNYSGGANDAFLMGKVTGNGMLIKGPSDGKTRTLFLQNVASLNDWSGGTVLQGGNLQVLARATNVAPGATTNLVSGGLGTGSTITILGGVLDLRVDGAPSGAADNDVEFVRYTSGSGVGQDLVINGSSQINLDRNSYQGTYTRAGNVVTATLPGEHGFVVGQSVNITVGANVVTLNVASVPSPNTFTYTDTPSGTINSGFFAVNMNSSGNKMVTFNNLTLGSQILTVAGGNGYGMAVAGTTTLLGNAFLNNGLDLVLGGAAGTSGVANSITTGGGQVLINKIGTGTLWVHSTNNNLTGPIYLNAGLLDWGNRHTHNNTATLGTGTIYVNPGAQMRVRATTNINTALGQQIVLTGTSYSPAVLRPTVSFTQAEYQSMIATTNPTSNENSIIAFEGGTLDKNLDQSTIGNGRVFFGNVGDRTLTGTGVGSIIPGLANLPDSVVGGTSTNRVYRFGGGSVNTLNILLAGTGNLTDAGGATDVLIGSQGKLGPAGDLYTGFVYLQDQNTYTGQTVVSRGMNLRFNQGMNASNTAGPLGSNAGALIDVYGNLRTENGSSLRDNAGTGQFYTNINFHPGSLLTFQDAQASGNRWDDNTVLKLDGAGVNVTGGNNVNLASEVVGDLSFDRGARIFLSSQGTGDAIFTASSVNRASASAGAGTGRGTLVFVPAAASRLGIANTSNNAEQAIFTTGPTISATSAVTGMLPGYFIDGQAHRFVTYGAANGIAPVGDGSMVAFTAGMTAGTAVVNVTANLNLPDFNPSIYALRGGAFTLNSPTGANNDATITLGGSGADIGSVISAGAFVINPNLKFGASGTNEALFYAGGTLTVNGNITAGSITKFGTGGTLVITNDQSDAARGVGQGYQGGWVVNEGAIQFAQFGSAGNAHPDNTIVLNSSRAGNAQLNLRAQPADSLLNYTYTSGRIITVDSATIDWDPGAADRVHRIADLEIQQSGGIGNGTANGTNDALLRVAVANVRNILAAGQLFVTNNAILNVDTTTAGSPFSAYAGNAAYLSNGLSSGLSVASLSGSERLTKWGDGYLYIRGASPDFSGSVVIDQGPVHVTHNQSLGSGPLTVNRYGVLDIGVAGYAATNSSVTYNEGSIERWSVNNARSGNLNLGKATLQIAADQPTTSVNITLNGGGIEAWLRNDDQIGAQANGGVLRVLNPNITFNLASNSFIGSQYYLGANGLDNGKQTHDNRPLEEYLASGALLDIKGVISGMGGLTKVGYDTVFLSGSNTYQGATKVEGGKLMIGKDNALPITTTLSTTANGVLDLNGQNQTVGILTNPVVATGVNSTSGFITNSATAVNTLTVGNTVVSDFTYSGVIQHNVALNKTGSANFTLTNANTYTGATHINQGNLTLGANASVHDTPWINIAGAASTFDVSAKTNYVFDGKVTGGGADVAGTTFGTVVNAAKISGAFTVGDHLGEISRIGSLAPGGNSIAGDITTAGNQIGHIYTNNNLTLSGELAGSTPAVAVTRLNMQLNGATSNLTTLGYTPGGDLEAFITGLASGSTLQQNTLNGVQGNLTGHDYVNVGGTLNLNANGRVVVNNFDSYTPNWGDVFNLFDWVGALGINSFNINGGNRYATGSETNTDLDLPTLTNLDWAWDTSLFQSHGVIIVVPEPSRMLLLFLGLMGLFFRRRRD